MGILVPVLDHVNKIVDDRERRRSLEDFNLCVRLFVLSFIQIGREKSQLQLRFSLSFSDMSSIPLWKYHRASDQWLERQFSSEEQKMPRSVFRVLTYNIWFSKEHQPRRFQGLCRILEESHADVIGLQEGFLS